LVVVFLAHPHGPIAPCGACRQVILELGGDDLPVLLTNLKGDVFETTAAQQLPNGFNPRDLS
jgi:cytidine deaminase